MPTVTKLMVRLAVTFTVLEVVRDRPRYHMSLR